MVLRGNKYEKGNLQQFFGFRIEVGDSILKAHLETDAKNDRYTSHRTQNELMSI